MEQELLKRINELAAKAKAGKLTPDEVEERDLLRKQYIAAFREGARQTFESIRIKEDDGSLTPLRKRSPEEVMAVKEAQREHDKHHHHHHHHHNHAHDHNAGECHCHCHEHEHE